MDLLEQQCILGLVEVDDDSDIGEANVVMAVVAVVGNVVVDVDGGNIGWHPDDID